MRNAFVKKALETAGKLTHYNYKWVLFKAFFDVHAKSADFVDSSVEGKLGVCNDYVTEPARMLAKIYPPFATLQHAVNPFQLFKSNAIKIVAAVNLDRGE
jgi:hypothetical protein